jgi:chromosome segregation ATPase
MEHVCKTSEPYSVHKEVQYHKQLLAFEEIRTTEKKEREAITKELEEMKKQRDELVEKLKVEFGSLIQREREIGTRLINIKTGKAISNSTVEQLLSRQTRKLKEVSEVRLDFIKLRDRVTAKEAQLQSLETVGENIRLIDYEKLQMENQSYADKIEDRDEKLQCLRNKATSAIQMIAHMKKKSHATDEKMDKLCKILEYTSTEVSNVGLPYKASAELYAVLVHTFSMLFYFHC